MKKEDLGNTYRYLHKYGKQVVEAIRKRIRQDKLIDTGDLLKSIDYYINDKGGKLQVIFTIGDGNFKYGSGLPSEYGAYQDQGTIYIDPHYFFTAPVPGLTSKDFARELAKAMQRDIDAYVRNELKRELKSITKK